jgi:hypothetical protein
MKELSERIIETLETTCNNSLVHLSALKMYEDCKYRQIITFFKDQLEDDSIGGNTYSQLGHDEDLIKSILSTKID